AQARDVGLDRVLRARLDPEELAQLARGLRVPFQVLLRLGEVRAHVATERSQRPPPAAEQERDRDDHEDSDPGEREGGLPPGGRAEPADELETEASHEEAETQRDL